MTKLTKDEILKLRFRQLEHVARQLDARETRVRSANVREKWLQRQTNANYRQEFDRIRGELSRTTVGPVPPERLRQRAAYLHGLFSRSNV